MIPEQRPIKPKQLSIGLEDIMRLRGSIPLLSLLQNSYLPEGRLCLQDRKSIALSSAIEARIFLEYADIDESYLFECDGEGESADTSPNDRYFACLVHFI